MPLTPEQIATFLASVHPYDSLSTDDLAQIASAIEVSETGAGEPVYELDDTLRGLYILHEGQVEVRDSSGAVVSRLGPRNSFGERGLLRDGKAVTLARTLSSARLLILPPDLFRDLISMHRSVARFFDRSPAPRPQPASLATCAVETLMTRAPRTCLPGTPVREAARQMREHGVSSLCVTEDKALQGIVTTRDLAGKVVAEALPPETPVARIMAARPLTLPPSAIGSDVLHAMMERRIGHIPIVDGGQLVGIVTQTDLTRHQAASSAEMVRAVARAANAQEMAVVTAGNPRLLAQLVGAGNRHEVVTRLITDIADAVTRRLLALAEEALGPPPVPYLWLACGSQGRQEQTGVSDQDNCLMLDDAVTDDDMPYFTHLATFVSDGLNSCGYVYCPGEMMATNPRWCQPVRVWREYFAGWIARPDPQAQMLASVMFDLRPIGGESALYQDVQKDTLKAASDNSIFVAHMISNSLKHTPPLGLLRGFATIRSGEHRNTLDLKHNGVVPVVDLGRVHALRGQLTEVGTRARLQAAETAGVLSPSGARDLLDAYDLIAETRLEHQAAQVRMGDAPDNYLALAELSDFERSHLRNAFVVVRSMQSALGHGKGMLG